MSDEAEIRQANIESYARVDNTYHYELKSQLEQALEYAMPFKFLSEALNYRSQFDTFQCETLLRFLYFQDEEQQELLKKGRRRIFHVLVALVHELEEPFDKRPKYYEELKDTLYSLAGKGRDVEVVYEEEEWGFSSSEAIEVLRNLCLKIVQCPEYIKSFNGEDLREQAKKDLKCINNK